MCNQLPINPLKKIKKMNCDEKIMFRCVEANNNNLVRFTDRKQSDFTKSIPVSYIFKHVKMEYFLLMEDENIITIRLLAVKDMNLLHELVIYAEHHEGKLPRKIEGPFYEMNLTNKCSEWDVQFINRLFNTYSRDDIYDLMNNCYIQKIMKPFCMLCCAKLTILMHENKLV